ncbi:MAG: hypothetical protein NW215_02855 [Hyphomicrobiales bacterium]|nr:hypothetical protein [Hyphomicrobiales bacterium]
MAGKDPVHPADRLERIFEVIAAEARARPEFASRLLAAIDGAAKDVFNPFAPEGPSWSAAPSFSFVATLHMEGSEALKAKMRAVGSAEVLLAMADEQHIPYNQAVDRKNFSAVVDRLAEGALFRLNARLAAAQ